MRFHLMSGNAMSSATDMLRSNPTKKGGRKPRGLQLNAPGRSYVEALGTVFVAATHYPRFTERVPVKPSIDGMYFCVRIMARAIAKSLTISHATCK
jgi:hypothetical protein